MFISSFEDEVKVQNKPFSLLQCVAQHMISTQVLGKEGMECQGHIHFVV